jgi:hypothetical protein
VDFNQMPVNTVSSQRQEGVSSVVSRKLPTLMVTLSSKEAAGSLMPRWRTDPVLNGPCDRLRVGIEVTYAAGGASLTGENHRVHAVDDRLLPERQPNDIVDLILSKI